MLMAPAPSSEPSAETEDYGVRLNTLALSHRTELLGQSVLKGLKLLGGLPYFKGQIEKLLVIRQRVIRPCCLCHGITPHVPFQSGCELRGLYYAAYDTSSAEYRGNFLRASAKSSSVARP